MNRETTVQDDVVTAAASPRTPRRLRFDYIRRKSRVTDHLQIDDALDAIGRARFPETWGQIPFFELLPFRIEKRTCVRTKIVSVKGKGVRLRSSRIRIPKSQLDAHRQVREMFRSALKELKSAVARGQLTAYVLHPNGDIRSLEFPDVVSTQSRWFFHHGVLRQRAPGRDVARRILIRKDDFDRWLSQDTRKAVVGINSAPIELMGFLAEIVRHITGGGYKLRKPTLKELIARAADASPPWKFSERGFDRLWDDKRLRPVKLRGRPRGVKGESKLDEPIAAQTAELVALMARFLERRSALLKRAVEAGATPTPPEK